MEVAVEDQVMDGSNVVNGSEEAEKKADTKTFKTALCQFYLAGPCKNGDSCSFAHGTSELRTASSGKGFADLDSGTKTKTKLCERFLQYGMCQFGEACSYAHGIRELQQSLFNLEKNQNKPDENPAYKTQLCKNYMQGFFCQFADKCGYAHGRHELRTKPVMKPDEMNAERKQKVLEKAKARSDYKTKICSNYESDGKCQYDELCVFAHGKDELRPLAESSTSPSASSSVTGGPTSSQSSAYSPHYKTLLCKYGANCTFGPKCTFAHSSAELRPPPMPGVMGMQMNTNNRNPLAKTALCKNFEASGNCQYGEKCSFAHGKEELRFTAAEGSLGPAGQTHGMMSSMFTGAGGGYGPTGMGGGGSSYKTVLCSAWRSSGYCESGPNCNFAHGSDELRRIPMMPQVPNYATDMAANNPKYKTSLCQTFETTGRCERESTCAFAHGENDLRNFATYKTAMCKNIADGSCPKGRNCHFAHSTEELRAKRPGMVPTASTGGMPMALNGNHMGYSTGMASEAAAAAMGNGMKRKQSMLKTSLCQNYVTKGTCPYGDNCNFAHGELELQINKKAKY